MDWFARPGANRSDTQWYREDLQRSMMDKDAVLCTDMVGAPH
jgi:hypothetical protein